MPGAPNVSPPLMQPSRKPSTTPVRLLGAALVLALTGGCMNRPTAEVSRLLAHPEFRTAAQAAPIFTADCLNTIARLEARR